MKNTILQKRKENMMLYFANYRQRKKKTGEKLNQTVRLLYDLLVRLKLLKLKNPLEEKGLWNQLIQYLGFSF